MAKWIFELAKKRKDFNAELLDLRDYPLPHFDEPASPKMLKKYSSKVAEEWNKKITEGDGYIVVTPEYNHGYPGVLKDALDYPYFAWNNKPIGFVSYGSVAGARAIEQLRLVAIELQMAPIRESINLFHVRSLFDEKGNMTDEKQDDRAEAFFDQLCWWSRVLKVARVKPKTFEDIGDTE